jgi:hypothetical protein
LKLGITAVLKDGMAAMSGFLFNGDESFVTVLLAHRRSNRVWLGNGNGGVATVVRGSFVMLVTRP